MMNTKQWKRTGLRVVMVVGIALSLSMLQGAGCGEFSEGLNDLTSFCKAVGEKCSDHTSADCVQKLGGDNAELKASPDYKGAKACVDELSSCTTLPDKCWLFAVERFKEPGSTDAGAQE